MGWDDDRRSGYSGSGSYVPEGIENRDAYISGMKGRQKVMETWVGKPMDFGSSSVSPSVFNRQNSSFSGGSDSDSSGGGWFGGLVVVGLIIAGLAGIFGSHSPSSGTNNNGAESGVSGQSTRHFPSTASRSVVFYPNSAQIAIKISESYFNLFGVSVLSAGPTSSFLRSSGFISFSDKIRGLNAASECTDVGNGSYKCFLISPEGRRDISKIALSLGAAKPTNDAPEDYWSLARNAKARSKGNWNNP